jgi:hypothetical protein
MQYLELASYNSVKMMGFFFRETFKKTAPYEAMYNAWPWTYGLSLHVDSDATVEGKSGFTVCRKSL